jgi:hypothetical protein
MNKLSKEKQTQLAIIIFVTVAAIGCIWYFIIDTANNNRAEAQRKAVEFRDKVDRAKRMLEQRTKIEQERTRATEELTLIEEGMAPGDKYAWFVPLLNKFSEPYKNVSLVKIEKDRPKDIEMIPKFPYTGTSFRVMVTAFYVDFGRYLADFENTFPYFQVQGIEVLPTSSPTEDKEKLDIRFEIVTLVKPGSTD